MTLNEMKSMNFDEVDNDSLVDISTVHIDPKATRQERIKSFIDQIKNPYCYKDNGIKVVVRFAEGTDLTIEDCLRDYLNKTTIAQAQ